ncbi:hypothetical protein HDV04_002597 [Boothiomyces sp. JEL0838]|nr:hypothetical protein HDV04_002597 [Boothiomyces sp. JEL0838]
MRLQRWYSITTKNQWYNRQSHDKYVKLAQKHGYRCRSAYKLFEIQEKFNILRRNDTVLDLGASPGGWSQVASKYGNTISVDLLPMEPIDKCQIITGDIHDEEIIREISQYNVNVVLSDMAHSFTGSRTLDVARMDELVEFAFSIANILLKPGGNFVAKYLQGSGEHGLRSMLENQFHSVSMFKPKACRKESTESYFICKGFKPINNI